MPRDLTPRTRPRFASVFALAIALAVAAAGRPAGAQVRRPVPNYDGRGPAPGRAADAAAWVPRVVLAPLRLVVEAIRRPVSHALRSQMLYSAFGDAAGISVDLTTRDAPHGTGFVGTPLAVYDHGRRFYVGGAIGVSGRGDTRHRLWLTAATGGERFFLGELWDRFRIATAGDLGLRLTWNERPDYLQYGRPGPVSFQSDESRFWMRRTMAAATASLRLGRFVQVFVASGVRWTELDLGDATWLARAQATPREVYGAFATDAELAVDTRGVGDLRGTGLRAVARMHHGVELARPGDRRWVVFEGYGGAYVEVARGGRVLGLETVAAGAVPLGGAPVPYAELPTLGGTAPLRGFLDGRFRGQTVLGAALTYRWPIWVWLEAETRIGVGNAYGPGFEGVAPGAIFGSWDVAMRSYPTGLGRVEMLAGLGTNRFDEPRFGIVSGRVLLALTRSF